MHDPLTVAFEIRRPWPRVDAYSTRQAARNSVRWQMRRHHPTVIAGRAIRWPSLITVWHRDPSGYDSTTCPIYPGRSWRFHVHHWRVQVHPLQHWRRLLLTRCTWCGGRSIKSDQTNISHSWDGPRARWWQGEKGLFHRDCSSIERAHSTCVCKSPALDGRSYGQCEACDRFRPFGITEANILCARDLQQIPPGGRRTSAEEAPDA
ncbi:hypothetical protein J7F02_10715 [Streptomyces sp. ISL-112]|uniref:hypothetical protein n=1 Tax=unclassified Streptomyces TaxID=2593676 RepID=UPI001BEA5C67|nr:MULTISPECIES: hypothetical protein [unclassified Streptomyces]MBT2426136.1 hypothetical protein [Streptomyces sp. ISL-112]MBT2461325.1 hypothetical protein [Streptomyces sp. ISL-63]